MRVGSIDTLTPTPLCLIRCSSAEVMHVGTMAKISNLSFASLSSSRS